MRSIHLLAAALLAGAALHQGSVLAAGSQPGQISSVRPGEARPARDAATMDRTDRMSAEAAAQAGLAGIAAGQLALRRSRDPRVREYARGPVADHQAANAQLQKIASAKGIALPTGLSSQQQRELQCPGKDFDKDFLEQMARGHQRVVDLFGHEAKGRHQDGDLKDFAQQTLVKLEQHLSSATILQKNKGHLPG